CGCGPCRASVGGVSLDAAQAVWIRDVGAEGLPGDMRDDERDACRTQAEAALWATLSSLDGFLLDPPEALLGAPQKPRVLQLAARLGLDVPRTLVTSSPDAVRAFVGTCPTGVVCKLVESGVVSVRDADRSHAFPTV